MRLPSSTAIAMETRASDIGDCDVRSGTLSPLSPTPHFLPKTWCSCGLDQLACLENPGSDTLPMEPQRPLSQQLLPFSVQSFSQITNSLFISNAAAANNKFLLSSLNITSVINATVEIVNTFYEDVQYLQVPVNDTPSSVLYDFFDPVADHIQGVQAKEGRTLLHCAAGVSRSAALCLAYLMKYHSMPLMHAHSWTKFRRPIIRPNNGFWGQLILYEYKLFNKNTVHMIDSEMGMIPDVYKEET
ncbi:dual specificity protein phosphatase 21 [Tenrec ecaudatus]|uniref:dual specificity protein phosphatase 21 n=1 Tax=Tenrec ecaudatus TaxID=94439 RepID=UPI003F5A1BEE